MLFFCLDFLCLFCVEVFVFVCVYRSGKKDVVHKLKLDSKLQHCTKAFFWTTQCLILSQTNQDLLSLLAWVASLLVGIKWASKKKKQINNTKKSWQFFLAKRTFFFQFLLLLLCVKNQTRELRQWELEKRRLSFVKVSTVLERLVLLSFLQMLFWYLRSNCWMQQHTRMNCSENWQKTRTFFWFCMFVYFRNKTQCKEGVCIFDQQFKKNMQKNGISLEKWKKTRSPKTRSSLFFSWNSLFLCHGFICRSKLSHTNKKHNVAKKKNKWIFMIWVRFQDKVSVQCWHLAPNHNDKRVCSNRCIHQTKVLPTLLQCKFQSPHTNHKMDQTDKKHNLGEVHKVQLQKKTQKNKKKQHIHLSKVFTLTNQDRKWSKTITKDRLPCCTVCGTRLGCWTMHALLCCGTPSTTRVLEASTTRI